MSYKEFLKQYNLTDAEIGKMFGYSTPQSWHNAARREKVIKGILKLNSIIIKTK